MEKFSLQNKLITQTSKVNCEVTPYRECKEDLV